MTLFLTGTQPEANFIKLRITDADQKVNTF